MATGRTWYVVLHYQVVHYLSSVSVALFATGPFEQEGWTFHLNTQTPYVTKGDDTCVPLFKDRVTGFHWLVDRTHTSPTILGRRELFRSKGRTIRTKGVDGVTLKHWSTFRVRAVLSKRERLHREKKKDKKDYWPLTAKLLERC
jgi:hypothetical protein